MKRELPNEKIYRYLVEKANDGIAILQDSKFKYVNSRLLNIIGYTSKEILRLPFQVLFPTGCFEDIRDRYNRRMAGEDVPAASETRLKHKSGKIVHVELNTGLIPFNGKTSDFVIVRDITQRKQYEEELHQTLEKLRQAMGATIQAITLTVEMRDPYTAGHQRRVSDLARSIATLLQLSKDKIDAIRMAASIHDLGKISIPSEILSKPGRLNETEFSLIKTHPQIGYDILKKIDFPWPIAQIVLQHHERLDGSGYPQRLKGNEIMYEAKILGVADVVEAMSSHRPYRSALELWKAFDEIRQNRTILYAPEVVDSCLKLFQEKGYELK